MIYVYAVYTPNSKYIATRCNDSVFFVQTSQPRKQNKDSLQTCIHMMKDIKHIYSKQFLLVS